MLEETNLGARIEKEKWDELSKPLKLRLGVLQQKMRTMKIPMLIVFEGWGASGKGSMISRLIANLDPRGFSVYSIDAPTADEKRYPWMRRFWQKLPAYGDIAIFDRSWYRSVTLAHDEEALSHKELDRRFEEIADFEQQVTDDGYLLLKFFLHISQKEQKKRFKALESHKETRWRVTKADWKHNAQYDKQLTYFEEMLYRSDHCNTPWTVVEATDKRYATLKVFTTVIQAIEQRLAQMEQEKPQASPMIRTSADIVSNPTPRLCDIRLDCRIESEEEYRKELKASQKRLAELHNRLYQRKIPVILAYEGWDAAGKGGNIKRISRALDPRGYEVVPICAPTPAEKNRQYLWRFWNQLPRDGHIAIFDRTWYGRVMVEKLEGFCTVEEWSRAYDEINRFERSLADWGAVIMKFWMQIDKEEQLRRFTERQNTPEKQYKITDEDWRNREKWEAYEQAVDEMLLRTNTSYAPWIVVESNDKWYARIKAMRTMIDALENRLNSL
ncbi:MAG: polyphosphate:AMP phosphotransferase [Anaerotruncus sp.]|jgi:polyphosphate:AMP phosphotransferase|nr:polyphosphate:AMP phosphotransferase [Anaerotruncus sp.]